MHRRLFVKLGMITLCAPQLITRRAAANENGFKVTYFDVPAIRGSRDVTAAGEGRIWVCGQRNGTLGLFDPRDQNLRVIPLGEGAAPHGVITDKDGAAWVTEGGQNAIARVDPISLKVELFRLPAERANANLNTAVFDQAGVLWFTGQNGIYGRFEPKTTRMDVFDAPRGRGPYGMTRTPSGEVWYASLAGNHIARIDTGTAKVSIVEPPTANQGARRVWTDSKNRVWVSEWNSGNVSAYDTVARTWQTWKLPGDRPRTYSVYVDDKDKVWLTDFSANAIVRFDPEAQAFTSFASDKAGANVRQMDGRPGEAWGGESGQNRLVRIQIQTPA
ncbi:virginiamycin B lyase family protein [Phreatobacter stygius]|uniref:Virginiamycin B lyase n=1 Tax=Phreatobacter stygius TaxID=1940610 RepID=A0A4D7BAM4_9HYPH|nr:lyase [Phreatobacter stygius]QCI67690.1 lyase [Phreatobacter stygius]